MDYPKIKKTTTTKQTYNLHKMYYVMCSTYSVPRHAIDARCNIFCGSSIELRGDRAVFEN